MLPLPNLPALTTRGFQGESDFPNMVAVIEASQVVDQIERVANVASVARNYAHLVNCDPATDMLFVEVNNTVVGYTRVFWEAETSGDVLYTHIGYLHPEWRRQGIGRAMLHWNENRLREIAATHPEPKGQRWLQAGVVDTMPGTEALLVSGGYSATRHGNLMVRPLGDDLPDLPIPPRVVVRPVQADEARTVWDALNEAFHDSWGYTTPHEEQYQQWISDPNFDPSLWCVAFDSQTGEVAGGVLNFIPHDENAAYQRQRGMTDPIFVRRPWRKLGLARALIARSLHTLKARGLTEAALGVDTQNLSGALRLYQGMGYRVIKRQSLYRKLLA
jgi:GNAT superfamily N-acetyltransferase